MLIGRVFFIIIFPHLCIRGGLLAFFVSYAPGASRFGCSAVFCTILSGILPGVFFRLVHLNCIYFNFFLVLSDLAFCTCLSAHRRGSLPWRGRGLVYTCSRKAPRDHVSSDEIAGAGIGFRRNRAGVRPSGITFDIL